MGRGRSATMLTLAFDMRAPDSGANPTSLYAAALEQCAWADELGFTDVQLMEHHASTDGYLPSPIVLGSAVAGVTRRLAVRLCLVLLPLYDPLRIAEDLAVLDLISGGRLRLTVGLGYRQEEYDQFGVDMRRRPSLMEEAVETLKRAWTGEPFDYRGRRVRVLPRPAERPRPLITMGGASPASARRAARIADAYYPVAPRLYEIYRDELSALGKSSASTGRKHRDHLRRRVCVRRRRSRTRVGVDRPPRSARHAGVRELDRWPTRWELQCGRRFGAAADGGQLPRLDSGRVHRSCSGAGCARVQAPGRRARSGGGMEKSAAVR